MLALYTLNPPLRDSGHTSRTGEPDDRQIASHTLVGVLDLSHPEAEQPEDIAAALTGALKWVSPERLIEAPDCGMKYLPRLWPTRQP